MDTAGPDGDHRLVRLGEAIKANLDGRSQRWLAGELGIDEGYLSRIVNGQVPGLSVDLVASIEQALGLTRGDLLRAAGYVDGDVTVSAAVAADPALTTEQRRVIRGLLRTWSGAEG